MTAPLTPTEIEALRSLYVDGAWTTPEAYAQLGEARVDELTDENILHIIPTEIGNLYFLAAAGRKASYGYLNDPRRISTQINTAYLRLCAQDYGWEVADLSSATLDLTQYDRSGRGIQYQMPQGMALVFGQLVTPITPQGLRNIVNRFQSLALRHGFKIIVFTPNARQGQSFASRHQNILQLIHHLPNQETDAPTRIHKIEAESEFITEDAGPAITTFEARKLRETGVSESQIALWLLDRNARVEQARADLEVDEVMSYGQLQRFYKLDAGDLPEVIYTRDLLQPVYKRRSLEEDVVFFCASKNLARMDASKLAHRAGTKELRHVLEAPANSAVWKIEERNSHRAEEPDAYWHSPSGLVAVEYDSGTYSSTTIRFKIQKFGERGAVKILWGVPSAKRQMNLQQKFNLDVQLCNWWRTDD